MHIWKRDIVIFIIYYRIIKILKLFNSYKISFLFKIYVIKILFQIYVIEIRRHVVFFYYSNTTFLSCEHTGKDVRITVRDCVRVFIFHCQSASPPNMAKQWEFVRRSLTFRDYRVPAPRWYSALYLVESVCDTESRKPLPFLPISCDRRKNSVFRSRNSVTFSRSLHCQMSMRCNDIIHEWHRSVNRSKLFLRLSYYTFIIGLNERNVFFFYIKDWISFLVTWQT